MSAGNIDTFTLKNSIVQLESLLPGNPHTADIGSDNVNPKSDPANVGDISLYNSMTTFLVNHVAEANRAAGDVVYGAGGLNGTNNHAGLVVCLGQGGSTGASILSLYAAFHAALGDNGGTAAAHYGFDAGGPDPPA